MSYEEWKQNYFAEKKKIMADADLTPFEKSNAIRRLAGLEPQTVEEWNEGMV